MTAEVEERVIATPFGRTYMRTVGASRAGLPLVVLHGGPGMTWDYLDTLDALAETGTPLVYYDQLGSGGSSATPAADVTITRLLEQLAFVISATTGGGRYILFGHSAGCALALEHALKGDPSLAGLVLSSGFSDAGHFMASVRRLRDALPERHRRALAAGDHGSEAYQAAMGEFFARHVCRTSPMPAGLQRTMSALAANPAVFERLWGRSLFDLTGDYAGWSVTRRLRDIAVPALVFRGEYDEAGPECSTPLVEGLGDVREFIVPGASHLAHAEATGETLAIVREFIAGLK